MRNVFYTVLNTVNFLFILSLLFCSSETFSSGPTSNSQYANYGADEGLSVGRIESIYQDSTGYIWMGGSDGLARFDGYTFDTFLHDPQIPGSISENRIWDIYEDDEKRLWFATERGLNLFDPRTDSFTAYFAEMLLQNSIREILQIDSGSLWLATADGLAQFEIISGQFRFYPEASARGNGLSAKLMNGLSADKDRNIWIATFGGGLVKFNPTTGAVERFMNKPNNPNSLPNNDVTVALVDSHGVVNIGTTNGFSQYVPETQKFNNFAIEKNNRHAISMGSVLDIMEDADGNIWVGTDWGLNIIDRESKLITQIFQDENERQSLLSNAIRSIFQDKNQDIWIGFFPQGISFFNQGDVAFNTFRNNPNDKNSLSYPSVLSFLEDREGRLWVGTDSGGLNLFDPFKNEMKLYHNPNPETPKANIISGNGILDVVETADGSIWAGTWAHGLNRINPKTDEITTYLADGSRQDRLQSNNIWDLYVDTKGQLWIGTTGGSLYRYDSTNDSFIAYHHDQNNPASLSSTIVWTIMEDAQGIYWIGTETGLSRLDPKSNTFSRFLYDENDDTTLSGNIILSILEDKKGRLWIGTRGGGLNLFDRATGKSKRYGKGHGFKSLVISSIQEDEQGMLWMGTFSGLARFDPNTELARFYDKRNGLQGNQFNIGSSYKMKDGHLLFGGISGYTKFLPSQIKTNTFIPPIVYRDLKLMNESVPIGVVGSPLRYTINYSEKIVLNHDQPMMTVSFSALNYRNANKNQYAYKLEGFDTKWNEVGDRRSATYTNLDAGEYVFQVKASNDEGLWSDVPKEIKINVLPPWWQTWWAYTFYMIVVLGLIYWAIEYQRRKRRYAENQARILEDTVYERTSELRIKNDEIKALLNNMKQGLFTISKNGLIHPEYSLHLEQIFEKTEIHGENAADFLFSCASCSENEIDQSREAISAILGEDELGFNFNSHLLLTEYTCIVNGTKKIVALDWNPLITQGIVESIMVSVRDVTSLRAAENAAKTKQRELEIIGQLLKIDDHKVINFNSSIREHIASCIEAIRSTSDSQNLIKVLFSNMHTIKGNSRTYAFTYLSDAAHQIEESYSVDKLIEGQVSCDSMLNDLGTLEALLDEYMHIFHSVLGRGDSTKIITSDISLSAALADVVAAMPSIAMQLGKAIPFINIDAPAIRLDQKKVQTISSVIAHILRNAIDHGIEDPELRIENGKPASGRIDIIGCRNSSGVAITVTDDGQGLNLNRLREIAIQRGVFSPYDVVADQEIAEVIFLSGLSTKDLATDISGRGVGMDAVRQLLREIDAKIAVVITDGETIAGYRRFSFEIEISSY